MQSKLKKFLGIITCVVILFCLFPKAVSAGRVPSDFAVGNYSYKIYTETVNNVETDVVHITGFTSTIGLTGNITLPDKVTYKDITYNVVAIDREAFKDCDSTKTFTIPASIKSIGEQAFFNCTGLEYVTFLASDVTLSKECFAECRLIDVNLKNIKYIPEAAFRDNVQLTQVTFDDNTQGIGKNAFKGCSQLKEIHNTVDGSSVCALPSGLADSYNLVTGVQVPAIEEAAFSGCSSLQNFSMEKCKYGFSMNKYAFTNCTSLTNLKFSDKLIGVGEGVFKGCTALAKVTLGKGLILIGDNMFEGCSVLSTVTYVGAPGNAAVELPSSIIMIGKYAFAQTPIVSINIPSSVEVISGYVFFKCTNLASIELPERVTTVPQGFCLGCVSLKTASLSANTESIQAQAFDGCTSLQSIYVGTKLVNIGEAAFNGCSSLTSFNMPSSVVTLGAKAFQNCNKLATVTMSPSVQSVPNYTFYNCTSLTGIVIGDAAEYIGAYAFAGCINLKTVQMPGDNKNLISIGDYAFQNCQALTSLRIPEGIKGIPKGLCSNCTAISSITLPKSLTTIGDFAFSDCKSLISLTIPENIITVPVKMCQNCTGLKTITLPNGIQTVADYAFAGCSSLTSVTGIEKATTVGAHVFEKCSSLKSLSLNPSINIVPDYLCDGCTSLTSFDFTSISAIGNSSFRGCGFVNLVLPSTITNIEMNAFQNNIDLVSVKLPSNNVLTTIKQSTFNGCKNLEDCVIPTTISAFGNNAFSGCIAVELVATKAPELATGFTTGNHPFSNVTYVYVPYQSTGYTEGGWANSVKNNKSNIYFKGSVNLNLTNFRNVNNISTAINYNEYTITLSPDYNYSLPDSINVTMTGTGASLNNYVSYDKDKGIIVIPTSQITGPFTITAAAVPNATNTPTSTPVPTAAPTAAPVQVDRSQLEAFVTRCYSMVLDRNPDSVGLSGWTDQLANGSICGAHVAYGFFFSPEFIAKNVDNETYVTLLYNVFLNRQPDAAGLAGWTEQLNAGADREYVYAGFANSQEFNNLCGDYGIATGYYVQGVEFNSQKNVNAFVVRLYSKCFGRLPDQGGQAGWVSQLLSGQTSGASAGYGFFFSPEFINRNTSNADYVMTLYSVFMGRDADEGGLKYWLDQLSSGMSREDVFRGFAHSAEYTNICAEYGIVRGTI